MKFYTLISSLTYALATPQVQYSFPKPQNVINYPFDKIQDVFFDYLQPFMLAHQTSLGTSVIQGVGCPICKVGIAGTQVFNTKMFNTLTSEYVIGICDIIMLVAGKSTGVCRGTITDEYSKQIFPVLFDTLFDQHNFCTFVVPVCEQDKWEPIDLEKWVFDRVNAKPPVAKADNFVNGLYEQREKNPSDKKLIKVALFSDIHIDFTYTEGANANCDGITCCQERNGMATKDSDKAGAWGSPRCDSAPKTVESMLQFINNEIKPDVAFWGGDSIPHNLDSISFDSNLDTLLKATELVKDNLKDSKLYATVGNHDTYPQDYWVGQSPKDNPILQKWKKAWMPLFDEKEQAKTFGDYGYYSQYLTYKNGTKMGKTPTKVISFNSNYCVSFNFHSWVQWSDPGHEIEWLEKELHELEKVGGAAILLTHVPNIHQCVRNFGMRWHALMDRYQHVIRWTMAAHNHIQSWNVERSIFTKQPIMMNYIIGSITPWGGHSLKKPQFVVMEMDPDTLIPVNLLTYSFDIKHANEFNEPKWDLDHDFKQVYGLSDLSPKSFNNYASKMRTNEKAAQVFRSHVSRHYEENVKPCDEQCRIDTRCYAVSNDYDDAQHCMGYKSWNLLPHNGEWGFGDGLTTIHSLFPNLWSRSWWRRKTPQKQK